MLTVRELKWTLNGAVIMDNAVLSQIEAGDERYGRILLFVPDQEALVAMQRQYGGERLVDASQLKAEETMTIIAHVGLQARSDGNAQIYAEVVARGIPIYWVSMQPVWEAWRGLSLIATV